MKDRPKKFLIQKRTLIIKTLLASSIITTFPTAGSMYLDYREEVQEMGREIIQIEKTNVPALQSSL